MTEVEIFNWIIKGSLTESVKLRSELEGEEATLGYLNGRISEGVKLLKQGMGLCEPSELRTH